MKKIKYGNVDTDNPLNWTQEDFDEVIYDFINVRVLSGQPIPPAINKWYCAVSQDIQKKRMGIVETTETDADRYRKALEEIEGIIKSSTKDFNHIDWEAKASHALTAVDKISDIINKAKGGDK